MLSWLYAISLALYRSLIYVLQPFYPKAHKWIAGRRNWEANLAEKIYPAKWIWFHCASLGEFEQGRPVMEALLAEAPEFKLLVSFYSPSGYEIRKDYAKADYVTYLPIDSPKNAKKFLAILQPQLVCFVKYDLWIYFLKACFSRNIPTLLISAQFRKGSSFLKGPFRSLYRPLFSQFQAVFVQNKSSETLLKDFAPEATVVLSSDTRYDRVLQTQRTATALPEIEAFVQGRWCLVGGSTWPEGESLLHTIYEELKDSYPICMILAPHEIHGQRIDKWMNAYPEEALRYSSIDERKDTHRILWIDNIGMLSRLYAYADMAYIGGAWNKGLHNTLEAVVFGAPVFFGPHYTKYPEAYELIENGIGFSVSSAQQAVSLVKNRLDSPELTPDIQRRCKAYIDSKAGATAQIVAWCKQHILE